MKLYCLSGHPTLPCNVLKFKSTTIMLDCGLDMTSTLNFLPLPLVQSPRLSNLPGWSLKDGNAFLDKELKECSGHVFVDSVPEFCLPETELIDLSTVDVILISNYHCMMALPYITEHTGFTGTVYATEPTVQIGRLLMEELVNFIERVPKAQSASLWKNKDIQREKPPSKWLAESQQGCGRRREAVAATPTDTGSCIQRDLLYHFPVSDTHLGYVSKEYIGCAPGLDRCHKT
uniref:Integrator complex subunit 9 n=1 Tax=Canis lupus familiaris TaxID=9615 RepID=A0A8P0PES0_CANLF